MLSAPRVSASWTASPENTVTVTALAVSVCDPAAPVAVEVPDPDVAGFDPLTDSPA